MFTRDSSNLLEVFRQRESLLVQLGKILDVNMKFDGLKMSAPSIPNDISFVKRQGTMRRRENQSMTVDPAKLEELSMFYITPNPAMTSVISTMTSFFEKDSSKRESIDLIVVFCKVMSALVAMEFMIFRFVSKSLTPTSGSSSKCSGRP